LFAATDLLGTGTYSGSIAPSDTLQAVFNIAQHPVTNYGYSLSLPTGGATLSLVSTSSPFQPILSVSPNDWSFSLHYIPGGLPVSDTLGSFAIDAGGDLWITDTTANSVLEWNVTGATVSPSTGYLASGSPIAIDSNGNVWISGDNSLSELTGLGVAVPGSPFAGVAGGGSDMAIDAQGDIWIAAGTGVSETNNLGVMLSPQGGFSYSGLSGIDAIAVDSSDNVWLGSSNTSNPGLAVVANPGGQLIVSGSSGPFLPQMAADASGDMWNVSENSINMDQPFSGTSYGWPSGTGYSGGGSQSGGLDFSAARGIAIDGAGVIWVASAGGSGTPVAQPNVIPIITGGYYGPGSGYVSSSLGAGPLRVAVDRSGDIWVLLADNTITEYVGVAAPAVTPLALAVEDKRIGAKP
jgi:hypothetical protein